MPSTPYRTEPNQPVKVSVLLLLLALSSATASGNVSSPLLSHAVAAFQASHIQVSDPTAEPAISAQAGSNSNWQPTTADEFLARGFARLAGRNNAQAKADAEEALKLNPASYMASYLLGRAAYEDKDYSAAIVDFDKVLQARPDWAQAYRYRGLAYSYLGQHQQALPDYEKLVELRPYLAAGYNDLGWADRELGEFDRAKVNFDKALEIEPDFVRALRNRVVLFANQNNWSAAAAELTTVLNLTPGDSWAKDAREAVQQKRPLTSDSSLTQTLSAPDMPRPDVPPKLISKVEPKYTEEARRASASARVLCSLVVRPDGVPEHIQVERGAGFGLDENAVQAVSAWRFVPATRQGLPVAAVAHVEVSFRLLTPNHARQLVKLSFPQQPGFSRPQFIHGKVPNNLSSTGDDKLRVAFTVDTNGNLENVSIVETTSTEWAEAALHDLKGWRFQPATLNGHPAEAEGTFEMTHTWNDAVYPGPANADQSLREDPFEAGPNPNWQPQTEEEFLARGYAFLKNHKYPQAEADSESALKLTTNAAAAWFLEGRASYEAREYSTALRAFDNVIRQKPDWPDAYRYRGLAYADSGQHQQALPDLQKAVDLDLNSASAYNALGWFYAKLGELELAKTNLDKAIELEPNFILARENRAKLFGRQGDNRAEQAELTVILGLSPGDRWAEETSKTISPNLP